MALSDVGSESSVSWAMYERLDHKLSRLYLLLESFGEVQTKALGVCISGIGNELQRLGCQLIMRGDEIDEEMALVLQEEVATRAEDFINANSAVELLGHKSPRIGDDLSHPPGGR